MNRRHPIVLPTLCWNRTLPDFHAVTVDVSRDGICLRSSVLPAVSQELFCSIHCIGLLETTVTSIADREFFVRVRGRQSLKVAVTRHLLDLSERQARPTEANDQSRLPMRQVVPARRSVQISLDDGASMPGRILNVSQLGVALMIGRPLEVGASILVGSTPARVVRHHDNGIRALFVAPLEPQALHEGMVL